MTRSYWKPRQRRTEVEYANDTLDLMFQWIPAFGRVNAYPEEIIASIRAAEYSADFAALAERISRRMVTTTAVSNAKSWREAARRSSKGQIIYNGLKHEMDGGVGVAVRSMILQNASLIRSVPLELAEHAASYIAEQQRKGERSSEIAERLSMKLPDLARWKVNLLARTGTSTAETTLTRARSEELGIDWYDWQTSEDARVRPSHRLMDNVLVPWSNSPSPERLAGEKTTLGHYHAGCAPNCRCVTLPLVRLDEVRWPHKVYRGNSIVMMTRAEFARFAGILERKAA